jgi:hypothetical protein
MWPRRSSETNRQTAKGKMSRVWYVPPGDVILALLPRRQHVHDPGAPAVDKSPHPDQMGLSWHPASPLSHPLVVVARNPHILERTRIAHEAMGRFREESRR